MLIPRNFELPISAEGVHVLPWFTAYKPKFERFFFFYLMATSGSGTHKGWLKNLAERAEGDARAAMPRAN